MLPVGKAFAHYFTYQSSGKEGSISASTMQYTPLHGFAVVRFSIALHLLRRVIRAVDIQVAGSYAHEVVHELPRSRQCIPLAY